MKMPSTILSGLARASGACAAIALALAASAAPALAGGCSASSNGLQAPCCDGGDQYYRSCPKVIGATANLKDKSLNGDTRSTEYAVKEHLSGTLQQLKTNMGIDIDEYMKDKKRSGGDVCNGVENSFKKKDEGACGGAASDIKIGVGVTYFIQTGEYGKWEDSVLRGGYVQALSCFHNEVVQELSGGGIPALSKITGSACQGIKSAYQTQKTRFMSQPSINQILPSECPEDTGDAQIVSASKADNADVTHFGSRNQNCNYLRAQRAGIEALFADLVACEATKRAYDSYMRKIGDPGMHDKIVDDLNAKIYPKCNGQCAPLFDPTDPESWMDVEDCAGACYDADVRKVLPDMIEKWWPKEGKCQ
jgi:hypothetical protein